MYYTDSGTPTRSVADTLALVDYKNFYPPGIAMDHMVVHLSSKMTLLNGFKCHLHKIQLIKVIISKLCLIQPHAATKAMNPPIDLTTYDMVYFDSYSMLWINEDVLGYVL